MEKMDFKYISDICLIAGVAKTKLDLGKIKKGKPKRLLRNLKKVCQIDLSKRTIHKDAVRPGVQERRIIIDDNDLEFLWNVVQKFLRDTGWDKTDKKTITLIQFCKAVIAQSDRDFSPKIESALDDIEAYYDRGKKLKPINIWSADLACQKWNAIWGIRDDGPDSADRLKAIDADLARKIALEEYRAKLYPKAVKEAV